MPDVEAALALTAAEQVAIGFSCNGMFATYSSPITGLRWRRQIDSNSLCRKPEPKTTTTIRIA